MKLVQVKKLQNIAINVAKGAGAILTKKAGENLNIREKAPFDLVTSADLAANEWIRDELHKNWPSSLVMAEEDVVFVSPKTTLARAQHNDVLWVVDPLDGTTNFSKRIPHVGVSIAAVNPASQEILAACIYDPWREECFTAMKGQGARLNGRAIRVSEVEKLHFALAATGFSYARKRDNNLAELAPFVQKCLGVRRFGAASLDLAWVACGRLDLYWESGLKPWDVAAGILIVQEALGFTTDFTGNISSPFDKNIVATNSKLHRKVLTQIRRARSQAGFK